MELMAEGRGGGVLPLLPAAGALGGRELTPLFHTRVVVDREPLDRSSA